MNQEEKELLLISISQEIRTPLNGIIGMTNELEKTNLNSKQLEILKTIQKASSNLLFISNSLIDLSKIETGETNIESEDFDPNIILNNIEESFLNQTKLNHVTLRTSSDIKSKLIINLDKNKLIQIIEHSLNNTIRNSYHKTVEVELKTNNSHNNRNLEINISNSKNYKDESLSKTDSNNDNNFDYLSNFNFILPKKITKLLGGTFHIKQNNNLETTINIIIPYQESSNKKTQNNTEKATPLQLKPNLKILIVEDNEMNIEILTNIFKRHNIICEIAVNGKDALQKIKTSRKIDLVLMDLEIPIMNGIETTKTIIKELKETSPPIIGLSVNTLKSEIKKCIEAGMSDYITKPFKEEKLIELIKKYTNSVKTKKEKLFDISNLMKLSNNDMVFTKKMLTLFLKIIDDDREILELKKDLNIKEYDQFLHKLKASLQNLNAISTFTLIELYESDRLENEKDKQELRLQIKNKLIQLYEDIKSMLVLIY